MIRREPITLEAARDFAREVLDLDDGLGNLREELRKMGALWPAEDLLARLLADDPLPLTPEDIARQEAVDRLEKAMEEAVAAWRELHPLLKEEGEPSTGPMGAHRERLSDWAEFERGLTIAASRLLGGRLFPEMKTLGLGGFHAFAIAKRQGGRRLEDGRLRRTESRAVMGALFDAAGAILERAFPGTTEKARGPYRWRLMERAARRFDRGEKDRLVTILPEEDWQTPRFRSRVKSLIQGWRKEPNSSDVSTMLDRSEDFPGLREVLGKLGLALRPPT